MSTAPALLIQQPQQQPKQHQQQQQQQQRRIEVQVERDPSQTQLSLALSPVLTSGYYSETLSQSVSQSVSQSLSARRVGRRSTPPPAPLAARDEGVVIQAGMSFVLGHKTVRSASVSAIGTTTQVTNGRKTGVRQHFRPLPAHTMADTTSSALTRAIRDFLGRTDHVINEWNQTSKSGHQRSRSSTRSCCQPVGQRRFSTRSLSSSRYSSSDTPSSTEPLARPFHFSRAPSFQSIRSLQSTNDTDFDS